jgi:hypothetical protein
MDVDEEKDKDSKGQKAYDEEGLSEWGGKWLSLAPDTRKPLPLRMQKKVVEEATGQE